MILSSILEKINWYNELLLNMKREEDPLNNEDDSIQINKGVELMLRNRKKEDPPKTFQIKFGQMVSLFKREVHFLFNFQLNLKKTNSQEEE